LFTGTIISPPQWEAFFRNKYNLQIDQAYNPILIFKSKTFISKIVQ